MRRVVLIGVLLLAGCAGGKIYPADYGGKGFGKPKQQAYEECRHEALRDMRRTTDTDLKLFLAMEIRASMNSCMRSNGYRYVR
jgi:hypothetical protein